MPRLGVWTDGCGLLSSSYDAPHGAPGRCAGGSGQVDRGRPQTKQQRMDDDSLGSDIFS